MFRGQRYDYFFLRALFLSLFQILDNTTRSLIYTTFALIACGSIFFFFGIQSSNMSDSVSSYPELEAVGPFAAMKSSVKLIKTKHILLLSLSFSYCGFVLTLLSGVLETAIGFTMRFHIKAKEMIGLTGVFISIGEVFGAILMGISSWRLSRVGRSFVLFGAFSSHLVAYLLIFLTLPNESTIRENNESAIIPPSKILCVFSAFLLGLGDAIYNTQIICVLSILYNDNSANAYALYKFFQSFFASISYIYTAHVGLYYQLLILTVFSIAGTICFHFLDRISEKTLLTARLSSYDTTVSNDSF